MEPSPAPRTPTLPSAHDFDDEAAPHQRLLPRRRSSVAQVFGSAALRSGSLERRASSSGEPHLHGPALAQSVAAPPPPPLFVFRRHEALRSNRRAPVPVERHFSNLAGTVAYPNSATSKAQHDKMVRKSSVMEAMTAEGLAHLLIDTKRQTLDLHSALPPVAAAEDDGDVTNGPRQAFTAFAEPPHPTDVLWTDVRRANSMKRKQEKYSGLAARLQPRWWRHLKLRDLSDFLTPGIFSDDELLMSSSSDDGEGRDGTMKPGINGGRLSAEVASARSTAGDGSAGVAAKSSSLVKAAPPLPSLHVAHLFVSAWTQHITTRSSMHWLTPRRHGVHGGKNVAEIGTMTTVSTRDFLAMCNSLIGISQSAERIQRFTIERDEHAALASLHLQFVFESKVLPSIADPTLLISVAETQDREDILDEEIATIQWLLTTTLFLPCEMATAAADRQRALQSYLTAAEEALKRRLIDETSVELFVGDTPLAK